MNLFFSILEAFVLKTIFNKDEYNFSSKNFNPVKLVVMAVLILNTIILIFFFYKMSNMYTIIEKECPAVLKKTK